MVREQGRHLLFALQVFLLGIMQPVGIRQFLSSIQANQMVMCRAVVLVHEMHVIRRDYLHAKFRGQLK